MKKLAVLLCVALFACDEPEDTGATNVDTGDTGEPVDTGSSGTVEVPDVGALVTPGGCGDILMSLASTDRTAALVFQDQAGLTAQAYKAGKPVTETYTLPADGALAVHQGTEVTGLFCNDAFTDDMVIDRSWEATAGTVVVTVTSEGVDHGHAKPATATITVEDAVLELDGEESITIDAVSWEAAIGWLPG